MKALFLIVPVIIFLGAIIVFVSRSFSDGGHPRTTRQDFTTLISHLDHYRNLGRNYPTEEQGLNALIIRPTTEPIPRDWVEALPEIPLDPWGKPYCYRFPGSIKENEPELISAGPDGKFGTEDDKSSQDDY